MYSCQLLWENFLGGADKIQSPNKVIIAKQQLYRGLCLVYSGHHLELKKQIGLS